MICHILTMGIPEPLQRILENAAREEKLLLFSLPDMETAERLQYWRRGHLRRPYVGWFSMFTYEAIVLVVAMVLLKYSERNGIRFMQ